MANFRIPAPVNCLRSLCTAAGNLLHFDTFSLVPLFFTELVNIDDSGVITMCQGPDLSTGNKEQY